MEQERSRYRYEGPISLKKIEERLLEIELEKPCRIYDLHEQYHGSDEDILEEGRISELDIEKTRLQLYRQFILDGRNGWKTKSLWDVAIPITVAVITAYLVSVFVGR
ncbi:MAG: hypothetical protein Q7S76_03120 [bacterium]|nr:hypothetical protein [bacterium]